MGKYNQTLGTLSKDVFEPRTSTGSEAFSLFICLDANKLVLLSFFSLLKTIYPRVSTKSFPSDAKSPLPVDVPRSKTLLLKLPNKPLSDPHAINYLQLVQGHTGLEHFFRTIKIMTKIKAGGLCRLPHWYLISRFSRL